MPRVGPRGRGRGRREKVDYQRKITRVGGPHRRGRLLAAAALPRGGRSVAVTGRLCDRYAEPRVSRMSEATLCKSSCYNKNSQRRNKGVKSSVRHFGALPRALGSSHTFRRRPLPSPATHPLCVHIPSTVILYREFHSGILVFNLFFTLPETLIRKNLTSEVNKNFFTIVCKIYITASRHNKVFQLKKQF